MALFLALWLLGASPEPLTLSEGAQKIVDVQGAPKMWSDDPLVADVRALPGQLLILGLKAGVTRLHAGARTFVVTVKAFDSQARLAEVRKLLGPIEGAEVELDGQCVELTCDGCSDEALQRLDQIRGLYPCVKSVNRIGPPRDALTVLEGARRLLGEDAGETAGLVLEVRGRRVVLTGQVLSAQDEARVEDLKREFPEVKIRVKPR